MKALWDNTMITLMKNFYELQIISKFFFSNYSIFDQESHFINGNYWFLFWLVYDYPTQIYDYFQHNVQGKLLMNKLLGKKSNQGKVNVVS